MRQDIYRYPIHDAIGDLTPLASVELHFGTVKLELLNLSEGGLAANFEDVSEIKVEDILDLSITIRGRSFPVQINVRNVVEQRVHGMFVQPSKALKLALKEFFAPKYLGKTLSKSEELSQRKDILALTKEASICEVYIAPNQTGVFLWGNKESSLLRIVVVSQDIILEWEHDRGLKTGRLKADHMHTGLIDQGEDGINWARGPEESTLHFIADILFAWFPEEPNRSFVKKLIADDFGKELPSFPELPETSEFTPPENGETSSSSKDDD